MAVAERSCFFPFNHHPKSRGKKSGNLSPSLPFEDQLRVRLQALLPIPKPPPSIPLSWLTQAVRLLSSILADATVLFSDPCLSPADRFAIVAFLDPSIRLLDACNSITAATEQHLSDLLVLRLAVRHLSSGGAIPPLPKKVHRARQLLSEWENRGAVVVVDGLIPPPPLRGTPSAVQRVIYAVESVACLVVAAVQSVLGAGGTESLASVSRRFVWSSAFDDVKEAVSSRVSKGLSGEVEEFESSVRKLVTVVDGAKNDDDGERMRRAVLPVERAEQKLTAEAESLSDAVEELFDSALAARTAALQSFGCSSKKSN